VDKNQSFKSLKKFAIRNHSYNNFNKKDETKLIATVKAQIDESEVNAPIHGKIDFLVDWE